MNEFLTERISTELVRGRYDYPDGFGRDTIREFVRGSKWEHIHGSDFTDQDIVNATEAFCEWRRHEARVAGVVNRNGLKYFTDKQIQDAIRELRGIVLERKQRRASEKYAACRS